VSRLARRHIRFAGIASIAIAFFASSSFVVGVSTAAAPDATALSACKAISKLANQIPKRGAKRSKKALRSYARAQQKLSASGAAGASEIGRRLKTAKGAAAKASALARAAVWCGPILAAAASGGEATTQPPSTTSPPQKAKREYPAHGPTDPLFPTQDDAYDLLLTTCTSLVNKTQTEWPRQELEAAQGKDTFSLYESAAYACVGRWDDAIRTFATIDTADPKFTGELGGNVCARKLVLQWLSALIKERKNDPTFSPDFVQSSSPSVTCEEEAPTTSDSLPTTSTTPTR
jgi:hypothetical protein